MNLTVATWLSPFFTYYSSCPKRSLLRWRSSFLRTCWDCSCTWPSVPFRALLRRFPQTAPANPSMLCPPYQHFSDRSVNKRHQKVFERWSTRNGDTVGNVLRWCITNHTTSHSGESHCLCVCSPWVYIGTHIFFLIYIFKEFKTSK